AREARESVCLGPRFDFRGLVRAVEAALINFKFLTRLLRCVPRRTVARSFIDPHFPLLNRLDTERDIIMKLVIIVGTGLIGSKLVTGLRGDGPGALPAFPETGGTTLAGRGLAEALQGASVVVDVSNSPSFEDKAVMEFFTTSTSNLLKYAAAAGVGHYVALSVVGTGRIPDSPSL